MVLEIMDSVPLALSHPTWLPSAPGKDGACISEQRSQVTTQGSDDKLKSIREYNKLMQRKSRAKRKAEETALAEKVQELESQVRMEKAKASILRTQAEGLRAREATAARQLQALLEDSMRQQHSDPPQPAKSPPAHVQTAERQATSNTHPSAGTNLPCQPVNSSERRQSGDTSSPSSHGAARPVSSAAKCAIFEDSKKGGHVHRHDVRVSLHHVGTDGPVLESLLAFRAETAQRLGCRVEDICWLYEPGCTKQRAAHQNATCTTHLGRAPCLGMVMVFWMCQRFRLFAHLSACRRLQAARAALDTTTSCTLHSPPPITHPLTTPFTSQPSADSLMEERGEPPGGCVSGASPSPSSASDQPSSGTLIWVDAGAARRIEVSEVVSAKFQWQIQREAAAAADALNQPCAADFADEPLLQEQPAENPPGYCPMIEHMDSLLDSVSSMSLDVTPRPPVRIGAHCQASSDLANTARELLTSTIRDFMPRMNHNDALHVVQQLRDIALLKGNRNFESLALSFDALTAKKAYAIVLSVLRTVWESAVLDCRFNPPTPAAPSTLEEIDAELAAECSALDSTYKEFQVLLQMLLMDGDELQVFKNMKFGVSAVEVLGLAKVESHNVRAYAELNLTTQQKRAIVERWTAFQADFTQGRRDFQAVVKRLEELPTHTALADFAVGTHLLENAPPRLGRSFAAGTQPPPAQPAMPQHSAPAATPTPGEGHEGGHWTHALLGVSPEVTERAGAVLAALREALRREDVVRLSYGQRFSEVLSPEQRATLLTCSLPMEADIHRLAIMAETDLARERVFGRAGIAMESVLPFCEHLRI